MTKIIISYFHTTIFLLSKRQSYISAVSHSHAEVVEIIKKSGDEVSMLVLDPETRMHYGELSVIVNSDMPEVVRICSWSETSAPEAQSTGSFFISDYRIHVTCFFPKITLVFSIIFVEESQSILDKVMSVDWLCNPLRISF